MTERSDRRFQPGYLELARSGELSQRVEHAREMLGECRLCPRECQVDRLAGQKGHCRVGDKPFVSSSGPHFGEESPLVGKYGSGTIFLTFCNLGCLSCQNYDISHLGQGSEIEVEALAQMMLSLQGQGCHNINFVTPTHQVPQILAALQLAIEHGLSVPLVYNTGGYDSVATVKLLDGIFDIYMPDCKYSDNSVAARLSDADDYWERNQAAVREMHQQVGDLQMDKEGIATRGLLVRHLVLPQGLAGTGKVMEFLASLSKDTCVHDTYVNVMAQYRPCYRANEIPEMNRQPTAEEYRQAVRLALDAGLHRLDERPLLRFL